MAADPEKPRRKASETIEYQSEHAESGVANETENAEDRSERRNVETEAEAKEDSV